MSDNEQKYKNSNTVADIVAMVRWAAQSCDGEAEKSEGLLRESFELSASNYRMIANLVEAAWKRERAKIEADALEVGGIVEAARTAEKSSAVGNAAAMREALVAVKKSIDGIGESSLDCDPTILMAALTQVCARLSARIERALSAPVRNIEQLAAPTDSNGNTIHVADKVHMLNTDSRGDHEWDDEVYSLEFIGSGGGDKWLIHGHKGAAWACECTVITTSGEGEGDGR